MDFRAKEQLINNYLDKVYGRFLQDASRISSWDTLVKHCQLEPKRLSNYAIAVKEELISEIMQLPSVLELDADKQNRLITDLNDVKLQIPDFAIDRERCMEEATASGNQVAGSRPEQSSKQHKKGSLVNAGLPIGGLAGVGIGAAVAGSLPVIVLSGVGGAIVGSLIGLSISQSTSGRQAVPAPSRTNRTSHKAAKVSQRKFGNVVQHRKLLMITLFQNYVKQLEELCSPLLK